MAVAAVCDQQGSPSRQVPAPGGRGRYGGPEESRLQQFLLQAAELPASGWRERRPLCPVSPAPPPSGDDVTLTLLLLPPQRPSHEASEGEDVDAGRGHFLQRLPVCAC